MKLYRFVRMLSHNLKKVIARSDFEKWLLLCQDHVTQSFEYLIKEFTL